MPPKKPILSARPAGYSDSDDDDDSDGFEFSGSVFNKKKERTPYVRPSHLDMEPIPDIDWSDNGFQGDKWAQDTRTPRGTPAQKLRHNIMKKDVALVIQLFNKKEVLVNQILEDGWTFLMTACRVACPPLVDFFIKEGANVGYSNADGFTCLMAVADRDNDLPGALETIKLLLAADANINAVNARGQTPLMLAAAAKRVEVVRAFLDGGAMPSIDLQDNCGRTALILAAEQGFGLVCRLLVERNANLFLYNDEGLSAHDCAIDAEHHMVAHMLYAAETTKWRPGLPLDLMKEDNFDRPSREDRYIDRRVVKARIAELSQIDMTLDMLGLEEYKPAFSAHDLQYIDFLRLTDESLIEIGIPVAQHRTKILEAIKSIHDRDWGDAKILPVTLQKNITDAERVSMILSINKYLVHMTETVAMIHTVLRGEPNLYECGVETKSIPEVISTVNNTNAAVGVFLEKVVTFKKFIIAAHKKEKEEAKRQNKMNQRRDNWRQIRWVIIGASVLLSGALITSQVKPNSPTSSVLSSIVTRFSMKNLPI